MCQCKPGYVVSVYSPKRCTTPLSAWSTRYKPVKAHAMSKKIRTNDKPVLPLGILVTLPLFFLPPKIALIFFCQPSMILSKSSG